MQQASLLLISGWSVQQLTFFMTLHEPCTSRLSEGLVITQWIWCQSSKAGVHPCWIVNVWKLKSIRDGKYNFSVKCKKHLIVRIFEFSLQIPHEPLISGQNWESKLTKLSKAHSNNVVTSLILIAAHCPVLDKTVLSRSRHKQLDQYFCSYTDELANTGTLWFYCKNDLSFVVEGN